MCMKFQNPSMHGSKVMLCIKKACNVKMPKVTKGHNSGKGHNPDGKNTCQLFFS